MSSLAKYALENPNAIKDMCKDVRKEIKWAATQAVNAVAFEARANLKSYVLQNFSNRFHSNAEGLVTTDKLFVTKAAFGHTEGLGDITASVGFSDKVDFMRRQDEGGWHTPKEPAKKLSIHTDAARSDGSLPTIHLGKKEKQTIRGKVIHTILNNRKRVISHKAERVARAAMAFKTGLLMFLGPNNNLFKVTDFRAKGGEVKFKAEMFINREYEKTYTPARHFFLPECEKAASRIQDLFNENMDKA